MSPPEQQVWRLRTRDLELTKGILMGVLNVTPDSFTDGGEFLQPEAAIERGLTLVAQGADIVDVGGESTRPGAVPVPAEVEMARVLPVIDGLVAEGVVVSVDTYKPEVAEAVLGRGVEVINDVRACRVAGMSEVVARTGCGVIVMHMKGEPVDMHLDPTYEDVLGEVEEFLVERLTVVTSAGVDRSRVAIDPGIGFGKTKDHNLDLMRGLAQLARHAPLVLGASRKRFLGTLTGARSNAELDMATAITTTIGFLNGARIFRVHDPAISRRALDIATAMVAP